MERARKKKERRSSGVEWTEGKGSRKKKGSRRSGATSLEVVPLTMKTKKMKKTLLPSPSYSLPRRRLAPGVVTKMSAQAFCDAVSAVSGCAKPEKKAR